MATASDLRHRGVEDRRKSCNFAKRGTLHSESSRSRRTLTSRQTSNSIFCRRLAYDAGLFRFRECGMKKILFVCFFVLLASMAFTQSSVQNPDVASPKPKNSTLYFVFLNRAPNAPTYSKEKSEEIQNGHMANIRRLHSEGKLLMAGPFMDDTT